MIRFFPLTIVLILTVTASLTAQSQKCFTEYMQAFSEWGMDTVPDGEQTVVIGIEEESGKQTCLMGKIRVENMNIVPPLYVLREDGTYEKREGNLDMTFYKREAEGPIPTAIRKAMTPTYYTKYNAKVRLFFQDYLRDYPGKRILAPTVAGGRMSASTDAAAKVSLSAKSIRFETGKDIIVAESYAALNEIAGVMKANPDVSWNIEGYTDNSGSKSGNMKLSQKRADAVKKYLAAQGVNGEKLATKGYGDQMPIADNTTAEGRTANRRVEIKPVQ